MKHIQGRHTKLSEASALSWVVESLICSMHSIGVGPILGRQMVVKHCFAASHHHCRQDHSLHSTTCIRDRPGAVKLYIAWNIACQALGLQTSTSMQVWMKNWATPSGDQRAQPRRHVHRGGLLGRFRCHPHAVLVSRLPAPSYNFADHPYG